MFGVSVISMGGGWTLEDTTVVTGRAVMLMFQYSMAVVVSRRPCRIS
jgi:hypothetical protein